MESHYSDITDTFHPSGVQFNLPICEENPSKTIPQFFMNVQPPTPIHITALCVTLFLSLVGNNNIYPQSCFLPLTKLASYSFECFCVLVHCLSYIPQEDFHFFISSFFHVKFTFTSNNNRWIYLVDTLWSVKCCKLLYNNNYKTDSSRPVFLSTLSVCILGNWLS